MSDQDSTAADRGSECNDLLGLLPEQAGWAVEMHGELVLFANNAERARGMSPGATTQIYTADQMRAYAAEQVAAERERCAKAAEDFLTRGRSPLGRQVADAIRKA